MRINELSLINFRNYQNISLILSPKTNIFIGNNATGKTNILESIYTLALSKSYKAKDADLIKSGEEFLRVSAKATFNRYDSELSIYTSLNKKVILVDKDPVKKLSEYIGLLNVVLFSPDDFLIFKNGPIEKRKFIDFALMETYKTYVENISLFKKKLKLRNDYLKMLGSKNVDLDNINDLMLDTLTESFIETNKKIYVQRKEFVKELEKITSIKYAELSGDYNHYIRIMYFSNFNENMSSYKENYKKEILKGSTEIGCHKDNLKFYKGKEDFETSCSQGEKRMLLLSLKLALIEIIKNARKDNPILLLDDVFSELDKNHQNRLLSMLDSNIQVIITTTDLIKIGSEALNNSKIFTINNGSITEDVNNG